MGADERDVAGMRARAERQKSYATGVPIVRAGDELDTGRCDTPEEVREMRARRPTPERISKLEIKHDELAKTVAETKALVAVVNAKTDGQTLLIQEIQRGVTRIADRDDVKFQSNLTINEAQKLDTIDAGKTRRWLIAKGAAALVGGGSLLELVHWIAGKL